MVGFTYVLPSSELPRVVPVLVNHATRLLLEMHSREIAPPVKHISIFIKIPTCMKMQEKKESFECEYVRAALLPMQHLLHFNISAALPPLFPPLT